MNNSIQNIAETRESFISLAKEVTPLLMSMEKILKDHGVTEMTNITITPEHITFEVYDESGWKLGKYGKDGQMKVMNDYRELLYPEQEENA